MGVFFMTFDEIQSQILSLSTLPNVDFFTVGYSLLGKPVYGVHIGNYDGNQLLIEGAIHAREYITSLLIVDQVKYLYNKPINGGIYFIPMTNPDGVQLVLDGTRGITCEKQRQFILSINDGSEDFSQWKANLNAVDLNVNFNAEWGGGAQNVFCPAPGNFVGYYPESEREVDVLIDFTYRVMPDLTLSFHTKGEVNYYGFSGLTPEEITRDRELAEFISTINTYTPIQTENSVGGYSDWVGLYLKVPAFTIELGPASAPTPIPLKYVEEAYLKNRDVPIALLNKLNGEM
jgi:g-D-glutamyl-meso-diaminopimelate peptidase